MKTLYYFILSLFFVALGFSSNAQNVEFDKDNFKEKKEELKEAKAQLKQGDEIYSNGIYAYKDALPFYLKANQFNPNNALLNYKIGVCYLYSTTKNKALSYLEKAKSLNPTVDADLSYYLGRAYHLEMQWDKAASEYTKFQTANSNNGDPELMREVGRHLKACISGKELSTKPIRVFVDNLGPNVNSAFSDYGPFITADESLLIFTSRRPGTTGGGMDAGDNNYMEDIYICERDSKGEWTAAKNMGEPVNSKDHDANSGLSADGQKFLIYIGTNEGDLYECVLEGNTWSKPIPLKTINTKYKESSACYSPDGNKLIFVSNREGGQGDRDIYLSIKDKDGKWGKPVNLGPVINTPYGEESVYLHPDGKTLYFSSQGHNSIGGYDIFKSVYDETTKMWSKPENMGYPLNTADDDVFFVLSANGRHGYYSSFNAGGLGEKDLYKVTFLGPEKEMIVLNEDNLLASIADPIKERVVAPVVEVAEARLTILKGTITDAFTKKPLEAEIDIIDNTHNQVIATFKSNSATGRYLVSLPAGKNYGIAVKKKDYLFHSENFDIPNDAAFQEVTKDVELKSLKVGTKIVLRNIFFDFDKATLRPESTNELERLLSLMNEFPSLKIEISGHTDNVGNDDYNKSLSNNRAKAVVDYLISKGIKADRMIWKGYGEEQPMAPNDTKENRQLNRRTEFKVLEI
jgi:outer membrane protein OmpA-like peptidoglycan-associated protein/tetratricopeptide (TPR) repeat protein